MATAAGFPPGGRAPSPRSAEPLALTGRLMRLEARHNAMLLMLPPVIVLFWFGSYRTAVTAPPLASCRSGRCGP